jgi:hypothetical protein
MPTLRCRVGDAALIVKGPWAGIVVAVVGYELVDPFHWIVQSQGRPFTFEGGFPDSVWARAIDDFLEPLRPDPDDTALVEPIVLVNVWLRQYVAEPYRN